MDYLVLSEHGRYALIRGFLFWRSQSALLYSLGVPRGASYARR